MSLYCIQLNMGLKGSFHCTSYTVSQLCWNLACSFLVFVHKLKYWTDFNIDPMMVIPENILKEKMSVESFMAIRPIVEDISLLVPLEKSGNHQPKSPGFNL